MFFTSHKDRNDFMQDDKQSLENTFHFASSKKISFQFGHEKSNEKYIPASFAHMYVLLKQQKKMRL